MGIASGRDPSSQTKLMITSFGIDGCGMAVDSECFRLELPLPLGAVLRLLPNTGAVLPPSVLLRHDSSTPYDCGMIEFIASCRDGKLPSCGKNKLKIKINFQLGIFKNTQSSIVPTHLS